ncbi:Histone-lysine N-methyltransferase, H3 lysine-79 specific, partial [Ophiophagus hannah]
MEENRKEGRKESEKEGKKEMEENRKEGRRGGRKEGEREGRREQNLKKHTWRSFPISKTSRIHKSPNELDWKEIQNRPRKDGCPLNRIDPVSPQGSPTPGASPQLKKVGLVAAMPIAVEGEIFTPTHKPHAGLPNNRGRNTTGIFERPSQKVLFSKGNRTLFFLEDVSLLIQGASSVQFSVRTEEAAWMRSKMTSRKNKIQLPFEKALLGLS